MNDAVDTIFIDPKEIVPPFTFDATVAAAFDDMAARSIPGYLELQACSFHIADRFLKDKSTVYDLGCSTGNTLLSISSIAQERSVKVIGFDSCDAMIEKAKRKTLHHYQGCNLTLETRSIEEAELKNASLMFMHYVLQFIDPVKRLSILRSIYEGLIPGGALFFSEKVHNKHKEAVFIESLYYGFKLRNGYSTTEILQKRKALEGVLRPLSLDENILLLKQAGFKDPVVILQNYQFISILAVKEQNTQE